MSYFKDLFDSLGGDDKREVEELVEAAVKQRLPNASTETLTNAKRRSILALEAFAAVRRKIPNPPEGRDKVPGKSAYVGVGLVLGQLMMAGLIDQDQATAATWVIANCETQQDVYNCVWGDS